MRAGEKKKHLRKKNIEHILGKVNEGDQIKNICHISGKVNEGDKIKKSFDLFKKSWWGRRKKQAKKNIAAKMNLLFSPPFNFDLEVDPALWPNL